MILGEISKGITHIEDLPVSKFMSVLENIQDYTITEKIDGSQILFGIDEKGFYTSRETRGGGRVYNYADYGLKFSETYMRSAHLALESVLPQLKGAGLMPGCQVEAEVLFGELPNVVQYSADSNYVIFLRTTEGMVDINRLSAKLNGKSLSTSVMTPFTNDGKNILIKEEINKWQFAKVDAIPTSILKLKVVIAPILKFMSSYLAEQSGINSLSNAVIENTALNKRPEWCNAGDWKYIKEDVKIKKEEIQNNLSQSKLHIKYLLLEHLVRVHSSKFGPSINEGGWIEGVVLRHKSSGLMTKVVDKNTFLAIKNFSWDVRNKISESATNIDSSISILGNMKLALATSIGHPLIGTSQAKLYLKKIGETTEERICALSKHIDTTSVKEYWINVLEHTKQSLDAMLVDYNNEKTTYTISVKMLAESTRKFTYSSGIDKRTKEIFASAFADIEKYKQLTENATTADELIDILISKKLNEIKI